MTNPFIDFLVQYQWKQVKDSIYEKSLYPFYGLLFFYSFYSLFMVEYRNSKNSLDDAGFTFIIFYALSIIAQAIILSYFLYREALQFRKEFRQYFSSFWNFTDLICYSLCITVIVLDVFGLSQKVVLRPIASVTLIFLWIKLFYYLRAYDSTS